MIHSAVIRCIRYKNVDKNVTTHKAGRLLGERAWLGMLLRERIKESHADPAETSFTVLPRALSFLVSS